MHESTTSCFSWARTTSPLPPVRPGARLYAEPEKGQRARRRSEQEEEHGRILGQAPRVEFKIAARSPRLSDRRDCARPPARPGTCLIRGIGARFSCASRTRRRPPVRRLAAPFKGAVPDRTPSGNRLHDRQQPMQPKVAQQLQMRRPPGRAPDCLAEPAGAIQRGAGEHAEERAVHARAAGKIQRTASAPG